jgi:hypothetical protein
LLEAAAWISTSNDFLTELLISEEFFKVNVSDYMPDRLHAALDNLDYEYAAAKLGIYEGRPESRKHLKMAIDGFRGILKDRGAGSINAFRAWIWMMFTCYPIIKFMDSIKDSKGSYPSYSRSKIPPPTLTSHKYALWVVALELSSPTRIEHSGWPVLWAFMAFLRINDMRGEELTVFLDIWFYYFKKFGSMRDMGRGRRSTVDERDPSILLYGMVNLVI